MFRAHFPQVSLPIFLRQSVPVYQLPGPELAALLPNYLLLRHKQNTNIGVVSISLN